jgi:hypothetical protein
MSQDPRFKIETNFILSPALEAQLPKSMEDILKFALTQYQHPILNVNQIKFSYPILYQMATERHIYGFGLHVNDNFTTTLTLLEAKSFTKKLSNFYVKLTPTKFRPCPVYLVWQIFIRLKKNNNESCSNCLNLTTYNINEYLYCLNESCEKFKIKWNSRHLSFPHIDIAPQLTLENIDGSNFIPTKKRKNEFKDTKIKFRSE